MSAFLLPLWSEFEHQQRFLMDLRGRVPDEDFEARVRLHAEGWTCALEDPKLLEDAGAFASFSIAWLRAQLQAPDARERAQKLPAALVKDACQLWTHLARASDAADRSGQRAAWTPLQAGDAVMACCALMREPLVESPLVPRPRGDLEGCRFLDGRRGVSFPRRASRGAVS